MSSSRAEALPNLEMPQKAEVVEAPEDLYPFSILLEKPLVGSVYDKNNPSADAFKSQLGRLTGKVLRANQLGQLAGGLEKGRIFRHDTTQPTGLYSIEGEGKGITLHDPAVLYERWFELEKKVNFTMQTAIRTLIDKAIDPNIS
jgi:hypothetical protein